MANAARANDGGFIASLRLRDFRLLFSSAMLSASGQWTLVVGRGWLVHDLTHSSTWVGFVTFAGMVPYLIATPIGGVLADRIDRRRLAVLMQGVSLVASAALALLVFTGVVQAWEVVALALLAGLGRSAETPATTSIIPNIVPPNYLLNAFSLSSVATFGSRLVGPAVGALLLGTWGAGSVFVMTAIFYAFAMMFVSLVHEPPGHEPAVGGFVKQNVDAWKYVFAAPMMAILFLLVGLHCGLTMSTDAIMPALASRTLHGSSGTYGLLVMAFGAGTMAGTFALGGLRSDPAKGTLLVITGLLSGLTTIWLAGMHAQFPAFLATASMGASQGMFMALANTLVQESTPDHLRGRVTSAFLMGTGGLMSIANLIEGATADHTGVGAVLLVPSVVYLVALVAISGIAPGLRRLYRTGRLAPEPATATA